MSFEREEVDAAREAAELAGEKSDVLAALRQVEIQAELSRLEQNLLVMQRWIAIAGADRHAVAAGNNCQRAIAELKSWGVFT